MGTENVIIIAILVLIVAAIGLYLYRAKKRGAKCIGCPYANQCGGGCGSCDKVKSDKKED